MVPYVQMRRGEQDRSQEALVLEPYHGGERLAYRDEREEDRDFRGVLYARFSQTLDPSGWPAGLPDWELVHPSRQRECMGEGLCHVCRRDVGQSPHAQPGMLFVEAITTRQRRQPGWPEGHITCQPPVCLEHAARAAGLGEHVLRQERAVLRARSPRWFGVLGTPYQCGPDRRQLRRAPTPDGRGELLVPFDDPQLACVLGEQWAVVLREVTEVDLGAELAAAGLT